MSTILGTISARLFRYVSAPPLSIREILPIDGIILKRRAGNFVSPNCGKVRVPGQMYKTEIIRQQGPWKNIDSVEYSTLEWVDWFNKRRSLEANGNIPPAEKERNYYHEKKQSAKVA